MAEANTSSDVDDSVESKVVECEQDNQIASLSNFARKAVAAYRDVKSTAVVKYINIQGPTKFLQLQQNTNLNEPPANWLYGGSQFDKYLRDATLGRNRGHSNFSSFNMALGYPDLAGDIDVISDSENIKKLLKLAWSKDHISMMVHRVGNTLLLDDFDIHKHLLRKQQEDWTWLRKFFYETVLRNMADKGKHFRKNKSRDYLQHRNLESKFLYYSAAASEEESLFMEGQPFSQQVHSVKTTDHHPKQPSPHQRTVLWEFEDLHMLIGTDLPIFGGGTHPCVSLRLRDMKKPINVLTGLDYWLDNLMCNVPELAMCFHLDGIVKSYELLKTEEIPNLEGSKFSPQVVKDIAQNILSFLKSNATKEGHTYWLFKAHDDEVVKLYDLSTLCTEFMVERSDNPFTIPVGILLFRVAQNLWQSSGRKQASTIRTLLQNTLLLLDQEKHAQVVAMANFILSDVYITDDITNIQVPESQSDELELDDSDYMRQEEEQGETSVDIHALSIPDSMKKPGRELVRYPPMPSDLEERCREAIKHVIQGLNCIEASEKEEKTKSKYQVDQQEQCNPFEAIPLHYTPLKVEKFRQNSRSEEPGGEGRDSTGGTAISILERNILPGVSSPKVMLYHKAGVACCGIAEMMLHENKYGHALKYVRLAAACFGASEHLHQNFNTRGSCQVQSLLLSRAGDTHIMLTHNSNSLERHLQDFSSHTEQDQQLEQLAAQIHTTDELGELLEFPKGELDGLNKSVQCYEKATSLYITEDSPPEQTQQMLKCYGNALNELGVHLMNLATNRINSGPSSPDQETQKILERSEKCFEKGTVVFEKLEDLTNMALLHSNTGRLMRLHAQLHVTHLDNEIVQREFTSEERHYYMKGIDCYKSALDLLGDRTKYPDIWASVTWELSSTYFTMATQLQDYAPLSVQSQEQVEREVTDLMNKALKYCDVDTPGARQTACQYRAATIYHRLASLYHNSYRNQLNEQKKRHLRTLAELHYSKASDLFSMVDSPCELLRVQLERFAMCEYQLNNLTSPHSKLKTLQTALSHIMGCRVPLEAIQQQLKEAGQDNDITGYRDQITKLLPILQSRLMWVTHSLLKVSTAGKKGRGTPDRKQSSLYKDMYGTVLKSSPEDEELLENICDMQVNLLRTLQKLLDDAVS